MRLTLRTLLAYLDDTLDPTQTKAIGQKVAESPQAQALIARIKEVMRMRQLAVPPATGPQAKLDLNTIAEYIDNALPADQLAEVEAECLDSDSYLAEIAACHQVLTVVLSEPSLVPPTAKQRMYGLAKGRGAIPYRKAPRVDSEDGHARGDADRAEAGEEAMLLGLPLLLKPGSMFSRLAPVLGVLLLAIALVGAVFLALHGSGEVKIVHNTNPTTDPAPPTKTEPTGTGGGTDNKTDTKPTTPTDTKTNTKPDTKIDKPPEKKDPTGERKEIAKVAPVEPGATSILLSKQLNQGWKRVPAEAAVQSTDPLVCLPGCRATLRRDNGAKLVLWGSMPENGRLLFIPYYLVGFMAFDQAMLQSNLVLHDSPTMDFDFNLQCGRIVLANGKSDGDLNARVRFHDEVWVLALPKEAEVAVELVGLYENGVLYQKDKPEAPVAVVKLTVVKGQVKITRGHLVNTLQQPPGKACLLWNNVGESEEGSVDKLPSWLNREYSPKVYGDDVKKSLEELSAKLTPEAKPEDVLVAMLKDKEMIARVIAAYSLNAIGDINGVLEAMNNDLQLTRVCAISALRQFIGQKQAHQKDLEAVLDKRIGEKNRDVVLALLRSYRDDQTRPELYEHLIGGLKHEKLPARELVYWHLLNLVPDGMKIPYNPTGNEADLKKAYDEWKKLIPDGQMPKRKPPGT